MTIPVFTFAEIEKLLFVRKDLSDLNEAERTDLLAKVNGIGLRDLRTDMVQLLLTVLHDARAIDPQRFLTEVFFPWCALRNKTRPHLERLGEELARIGEFTTGGPEEASHVANIYRNLVSDLFDPYLTLVVASFQFKERTFTTIQGADIEQGERNKYDYLKKRVDAIYKGKGNFLSGYDPIVRNAITHAGARGIVYRPDTILFRNIKRGSPPVIETVEWTHNELLDRTILLVECVQTIEATTAIFGFDCSVDVASDLEILLSVLVNVASSDERASIRSSQEDKFDRFRTADNLPHAQKIDLLSRFLFYNCGLRKMPVLSANAASNISSLVVKVPAAAIAADDDEQLIGRLMELSRYAILARSVFGNLFDTYWTEEVDPSSAKVLAGALRGADLDAYADEHAGLVDLLNDSRWFLGGRRLEVIVDFEALKKAEQRSADDPMPRRQREAK